MNETVLICHPTCLLCLYVRAACVRVCVRACMHARVHIYERACVSVSCVRACVYVEGDGAIMNTQANKSCTLHAPALDSAPAAPRAPRRASGRTAPPGPGGAGRFAHAQTVHKTRAATDFNSVQEREQQKSAGAATSKRDPP